MTESTWRTPVRSRVRLKVRIVGVVCRGSRKPWAASAIRRAWARLRVSGTRRTQPETADTQGARAPRVRAERARPAIGSGPAQAVQRLPTPHRARAPRVRAKRALRAERARPAI